MGRSSRGFRVDNINVTHRRVPTLDLTTQMTAAQSKLPISVVHYTYLWKSVDNPKSGSSVAIVAVRVQGRKQNSRQVVQWAEFLSTVVQLVEPSTP